MLGLAVLFGLGLWLLVTIVAMVIGAKFGRRPATKLLGAFLGFMLTMGGFIVYWTVEYYQIQTTVTRLCETEGGITVYVTPEEWRKQIGEEEWERQEYQGNYVSRNEKNNLLVFKEKDFKPMFHITDRINVAYGGSLYMKGIHQSDKVYYDSLTQKFLFRIYSINAQVYGIDSSLSALKFWLNYVQGCPKVDIYSFQNQYYQTK